MDISDEAHGVSVDPDERLTSGHQTASAESQGLVEDQGLRRVEMANAAMQMNDDEDDHSGLNWGLGSMSNRPGSSGNRMRPGENGEASLETIVDAEGINNADRLVDEVRENSVWVPDRCSTRQRDEWRESMEGGNTITEREEDHFEQVSLKDHEERNGESQFEQVSLKDPQNKNGFSELPSEDDSIRSPASEKGSLGLKGNAYLDAGSTKEFSPDGQDSIFSREALSRNIEEDILRSPASLKSLNYSPQSFSPSSYNASFVSFDGGSGFSSPAGSPSRRKYKLVFPDASPELMHLIESAIQESDSINLQKLRRIVCGEESFMHGGEKENVSGLVVDVLLAKMGGVEGLDEDSENSNPTVMLSAGAAIVAGELIPWLPYEYDTKGHMSPRTRLVKGLLIILKSCTRNRAMCSAAGLLRVLLSAADIIFTKKADKSEKCQTWDVSPLCDCLEMMGAHSLSVDDLRGWLGIVPHAIPTGSALNLTLALEKAMSGKEANGPAYTFEFDGESSGLLGSGESRWPFSNGYAFVTWLYIESFADTLNTAATAAAIAAAAAAKSGKSSAMSAAAAASAVAGEGTAHMPRLFSFISADNQGVEAYFHGQFLVVECGSGKGKKASLHFTHAFKPRCWYFIGLEHIQKQSMLGKSESELKLYLDGCLYESRPFEFPRISKSLAFCCIGTNPPPTIAGLQRRRRQCPLFAEMGPIYIFKEPIGQDRMARLALRGGDAVPSFGNGAGLPWCATTEQAMALAEESAALDLEIEPKIHLLYHPKLLVGRSCPDASPAGASGIHRRPAEVLGHVHVAARTRPTEALWAMAEGGPMSLLPLTVSAVDEDTYEPINGEPYISSITTLLAAPIFRMISVAVQHPGTAEELCHARAPEVLAQLLHYLLQMLSCGEPGKEKAEARDEELVAAIVSLCQSADCNIGLKVHFFRNLLLDLKMWSGCSYGLQKKLLSSLADMVFTEATAMRAANAVQLLLDGCRRCYWLIHEDDSVDKFAIQKSCRSAGELNALVDELLVIIELLVGSSTGPVASNDVQCLIHFVLDCSQPNQVARVLHLIYRLVVQPNTSRATMFAETFVSCGGIEMLLFLLKKEAEVGDGTVYESSSSSDTANLEINENDQTVGITCTEGKRDGHLSPSGSQCPVDSIISDKIEADESKLIGLKSSESDQGSSKILLGNDSQKISSAREGFTGRTVGGISFSISAESARNNLYNVDNGDGIMVGIISLVGALVAGGQLKFSSVTTSASTIPSLYSGIGQPEESNHASAVNSSFLLFALQKTFQAAPERLMTDTVYAALLGAVMNTLSSEDSLNLYDSGHRFEHVQLLLVLLRSLTYASRSLQVRAIQDVLFLACSHPENRNTLTSMPEWPEWLLEVLISNFEIGSNKVQNGIGIGEIEDLVHNFLIIMLEHSMRQKDGWKDIEATIHCAEWLAMIGGSSTGEQRIRREESLPLFKRRLLGGLVDFAARELQVQQTQVIAAAAAGVAAGGLSPQAAKAEAESATYLSMALAENAIVVLMLVEDHLRFQCQIFNTVLSGNGPDSPVSAVFSIGGHSHSFGKSVADAGDNPGYRRFSSSTDSGGVSLEVLASMADANGQISAAAMERLTAAAAAEPFESVRCSFVSYGSCAVDLAEGWKRRSRMWYGVSFPSKPESFGGGGSGWERWNSAFEKDEKGEWIELPLIKKSVAMLQALLLDECGPGIGLAFGGGSGTAMGGMIALQQLLDSDQPFLTMLRMVLVSLREEDKGEELSMSMSASVREGTAEGIHKLGLQTLTLENSNRLATRKSQSALLWSVLNPVLTMPTSESRRQRVLVSGCILYAEVWHAVSADRKPLRKHYLETILPPFVALLRRWRPLLCGIHELTDPNGLNPLAVDDRALAADALPLEAALAMISPGWASAFASPPAAMALAMAAAGAGGGEAAPPKSTPLRREVSVFERRASRLRSFTSFQKAPDLPGRSQPVPKDKAAAKAAALAAARDLERNAKIGSGRGLSAVAMATSAQRRSLGDQERVKRWNNFEAMGTAWLECSQLADAAMASEKDFSMLVSKYIRALAAMVDIARNMRQAEIDRRALVAAADGFRTKVGARAWRRLIHCLIEHKALFGPLGYQLGHPERVFWKLDFVENSLRMRRLLKRNYNGTTHEGAAANYEDFQPVGRHNIEENKDSGKEAESSLGNSLPANASLLLPEESLLEEGLEEEGTRSDFEIIDDKKDDLEHSFVSSEDISEPSEESTLNSVKSSNVKEVANNAIALAGSTVFGVDERLLLEIPAMMVQPLRLMRGRFQVTTKRINFIIDDSVDVGDPYKDESDSRLENKTVARDRSWLISALHEVYSRRYLLRRSALELFMIDRSNFFFNFGTTEGRRKVYKAIVQARPPHLNSLYYGTQKPEQLLKKTQLMERWGRWEISNFEYLMQLNTLAGRSYNDITQYPVFPWILADYTSNTLDFGDPSIYRDLSKPVGALNADRLEKFLERYSNFEDPVIPKFHYGSHYSSAGTVLYYLTRVEPFTTLSIQLQGGKFDHADRMFSDLRATWNGVLEDMSDVKELVPELFYLPEVLMNENGIDLGTTQLGEKIDVVKLPPWANSPIDFIHKHRTALESEHVSAHLNEWIDLIFGYKQRGKEAVAANNVFFYMTYEGAVDIDKISDPVLRHATQDQIAYFGQTPSQLLSFPHVKRRPLADVLHLQTIFRNPTEIKSYVIPNPERCNVPASAISSSADSIVIVDTNLPAAHVALHRWQPNTPDGHGIPFLFQHGKAAASSSGGAFMRIFKGSGIEDWHYPRCIALPATGIRSSSVVAITSDMRIITGGHADNTVKLVLAENAKTLESAAGHCAPVTCLAISPDGSTLVTGSRDATAILWRLHRSSEKVSYGRVEPSVLAPAAAVGSSNSGSSSANMNMDGRKRYIEGPLHVLRGHIGELTCCCINADLDLVVSCSRVGGVLLHSVSRGRLIRRIPVNRVDTMSLSAEGMIIIWDKSSQQLRTFTLNGISVARRILCPFPGDITCIEISQDGKHALFGTSTYPSFSDEKVSMPREGRNNESTPQCSIETADGNEEDRPSAVPVPSICLLDLHTLKIVHVLELCQGQDVTALALNKDNTNLVVSLSDKQLLVYTDPMLSIKVVDQMLRLGWQGEGLTPLIT